MKPTVAFIHTIAGLKDTFEELVREFLPDCSTCHIADETLIRRLLAAGGLTPEVYRRLSEHVVAAAEYGADYIQFTCSSITPCAEWVAKLVGVPVLSIDEPMVRGVVVAHYRIGVIATNPATLKPSSDLVASIATSVGRDVEVVPELCEGAYEALLSGDRPTHDRIVKERLGNLLTRVDAVCLAQASMARVADTLEHEKPVYSSPRPAIWHLGGIIREASDAR